MKTHIKTHETMYRIVGFTHNRYVHVQSYLFLKRYQSSLAVKGIPLRELPSSLLLKAQGYCEELKSLESLLSEGKSFDVDHQRKYSKLSAINDSLIHYKKSLNGINELKDLIKLDSSLAEDGTAEMNELVPRFNEISKHLLEQMLPAHPFADKPCIVELRPGVGGAEAMIFTQNLSDMYLNYAHKKKWKHHIIAQQTNESGSGLISSIIAIDEPRAYDRLRFEAGVHRVQRIPETESKGRTHTSTSAVVVLPQMGEDSEKDLDAYERTFKPGEIRIDIKRASGKGGQHVNTTDSAIRLTHIPTGIVVSMQDERSQHKNKAKAFTVLRARIAEREQRDKDEKERSARKEQVSTTDRSDKIRTYNYPQNRITDHRCGFTLHDIDGVMSGERLDEVIDAMAAYETQQNSDKLLKEI